MEEPLRPFEAKLFFLLEQRRERMGFTNVTNFYAWALDYDEPNSAYQFYRRLRLTAEGTALPESKGYLTIEDASKIARALQMDLSKLIRDVEEALQIDSKPFPIPDLSRLQKKKAAS
jgi:hypothetical protein